MIEKERLINSDEYEKASPIKKNEFLVALHLRFSLNLN